MKVPLKYIYRSLFSRKLTTLLTILGISMVSFLFCGVLMLVNGVKKVLTSTGEPGNVMLLQADQLSDIQSNISSEQLDIIENLDGIAFDTDLGEQMISPELVVSVGIENNENKLKNVTLRGCTEIAPLLRSNFKLLKGELFEMSMPTCIVGRILTKKYKNCQIGDSIKIVNEYYHVTGIFETGGTIYDSEIWSDIYSLRSTYNRATVSGSIILTRLDNPDGLEAFVDQIEEKPDLELEIRSEKDYYAGQAEGSTRFLKYLGYFICTVFALGATIGAMITMYSSVANRTSEIATMRALGFRRLSILAAFLVESVLIGIIGAIIGVLAAFAFSFQELQMFSTTNFFGEFYLKMTITLMTVGLTFSFAILMGLLGGVLPSIQASRMKIVDAFRSV